MKSRAHIKAAMAIALAVGSGVSHAALTQYNSLSNWLGAVSSSGVDTYANFDYSGLTPSPIARTAGAYAYSATAFNDFFGGIQGSDPFLSTNTATSSIVIGGFSSGTSAAAGDWFASNSSGSFTSGQVRIVVTDSLGASDTAYVNPSSTSIGSFLGWVSSGSLSSVTVSAVQPQSGYKWPSVDNFRLGASAIAPVPESSSASMFLAGLTVLGLFARRSHQSH